MSGTPSSSSAAPSGSGTPDPISGDRFLTCPVPNGYYFQSSSYSQPGFSSPGNELTCFLGSTSDPNAQLECTFNPSTGTLNNDPSNGAGCRGLNSM